MAHQHKKMHCTATARHCINTYNIYHTSLMLLTSIQNMLYRYMYMAQGVHWIQIWRPYNSLSVCCSTGLNSWTIWRVCGNYSACYWENLKLTWFSFLNSTTCARIYSNMCLASRLSSAKFLDTPRISPHSLT